MTQPLNLVWLRRDLRTHDHAAFANAMSKEGGALPLFIFDTEILARFTRKNDWRLSFIMDALMQIHEKAKKHGSGMLVIKGKPEEVWKTILAEVKPASISAGEDYEPATKRRDERIKQLVGDDTEFCLLKDHVIFAPGEITKDDGDPYKVYTPYSKAWYEKFSPGDMAEHKVESWDKLVGIQDIQKKLANVGLDVLNMDDGAKEVLSKVGYDYQSADITGWDVNGAQTRLEKFVKNRVGEYKDKRDMVAEDGTSVISPYLRFGLISIRECIRQTHGKPEAKKWVSELIWREFYQMVLHYAPESVDKEWQEQYRELKWNDNDAWFDAWCAGKTGYPIVDAAMRQLTTTGWMHNRARMIVASFLTKDMHIDWRKGEEFFAQYLMDFDLASNVGGWQWAASTGTDAQPYFRIFNPYLQSKKFDPEGKYIKQYVPELEEIDAKNIHEPHKIKHNADYPKPVVDHYVERDEALSMFKALKKA